MKTLRKLPATTSNRIHVKTPNPTLATAIALALFLLLAFPRPTVAKDSETEAGKIEALIHSYEKSVSEADTTLAAQVWAQGEDISFIHPEGRELGWPQIKQDIYEKLMRDVFSERKLTASNISIHVYKDAAWAEFNWIFAAKLRSNGAAIKSEGWETQIFHKTDQGWRLVHVHYSAKPEAGGQ